MNETNGALSLTRISERQWKSIYTLGGMAAVVTLLGLLLDIVIGNITGGDLSALPQTAIERFAEFHTSKLLGLYHLDLLNLVLQIVIIPVYFALYAAHRDVNKAYGSLSLIILLSGSVLMVSNNTSLAMLELSNKYYSTTVESAKSLYAAAGEALLAQGAHGSPAMFPGFFLPNMASLLMSVVMLKGRIFTRINSWTGITGSILMMLYLIFVCFGTRIEKMATAFAMPGGILLMAWMIMLTIRLFNLGSKE
jgi:hypothetical protein